jgi:hypothetical protein
MELGIDDLYDDDDEVIEPSSQVEI